MQPCPLGDVRVRLEGDCLEGVVGGDVLQQLRLCGRQAEPRVSGRGREREGEIERRETERRETREADRGRQKPRARLSCVSGCRDSE